MNINGVEQVNLKNSGLNLYKTFSWFNQNFSPALENAIQEFWGLGFEFKLLSIGIDNNFFLSGTEYFVTRIKLNKDYQFVVRLSKDTVRVLLDSTMGFNPNFEFEKITELEARILTEFNNLIYSKCSEYLVKEDEIRQIEGNSQLAFLINCGFEEPAKILISIPNAFLNYEEVFPSDKRFGLEDFPTTMVDTELYIGSTVLPISDIKNIEKEDIIVLENSNINNMTLKFENNEIGFKVSPDPSLIISFDNDNGSKNMSNNANIWDNIQVDISAEFQKVKISLGEIKQISEGLVVDMGSIYDNKVDLKVENKIIARGELVIINDRYGVRIDEVIEEKSENNTPMQEIEHEDFEENTSTEQDIPQETQETEQEASNQEPEEFDYKDFDVDDENI